MKRYPIIVFMAVAIQCGGVSAQAVSGPEKQVAPNPAAAWAAAYTFYVSRVCGIYEGDTDAMSASGAFPVGDDAPEWGEYGTARIAFHAGGVAAEKAAARDASLCARPLDGAGAYAPLVKRFLKPRRPDRP